MSYIDKIKLIDDKHKNIIKIFAGGSNEITGKLKSRYCDLFNAMSKRETDISEDAVKLYPVLTSEDTQHLLMIIDEEGLYHGLIEGLMCNTAELGFNAPPYMMVNIFAITQEGADDQAYVEKAMTRYFFADTMMDVHGDINRAYNAASYSDALRIISLMVYSLYKAFNISGDYRPEILKGTQLLEAVEALAFGGATLDAIELSKYITRDNAEDIIKNFVKYFATIFSTDN